MCRSTVHPELAFLRRQEYVSKPDGSQLPPRRHHLVHLQRRDQGRPQWRPETVDPV